MLNIHPARHASQSKEISKIGSLRTSISIADSLTKAKKQAQLLSILQEGKQYVKCELCIIREKFPKHYENRMK